MAKKDKKHRFSREAAQIEFDYSSNQKNFEIDLFWKRSWFFGALILAEIAGYYTLKKDQPTFIPPVAVAFITMLTILAQCLMNRGSKYWQEHWEFKTMNREAKYGVAITNNNLILNDSTQHEWSYIDASILNKKENPLASSRRFSVSKLTFLIWDIIFITCLLCWITEAVDITCFKNPDWNLTIKLSVFYSILCGYIICFLWKGDFYERFIPEILEKKKSFEKNPEGKDELDEMAVQYRENNFQKPLNNE